MPPKQWKSTCMDSPLVTASMDCFQSWPQTLFQTRSYQVGDSFIPTVRRRQCRVLQLTLDVKDFSLLEIPRPILRGALNLHFICAHGHDHGDLHQQSLQNVFQATRRFDASKQHRRSIRRFVDHGSVQRPLLYGLENWTKITNGRYFHFRQKMEILVLI